MKTHREQAIAIHKKYLKDSSADIIDYMGVCVKVGQEQERKRILKIIEKLEPDDMVAKGKIDYGLSARELKKQIEV